MYKGEMIKERYEILGVRGEGSFGIVYDVFDILLRKYWVMKTMRQELPYAEEAISHEALILKDLQKEGIPRVSDLFCHEGNLCLIMECMEGDTLAEWIQKNPERARKEAYQIGLRLTELIAQLHAATPPIVCGDIKPENIIMKEDGSLQLIDFGASKRLGERTGVIQGTYGYAPPEQIRGEQLHLQCDVYAIGKVISYMRTGHNPQLPPFTVDMHGLDKKERKLFRRCFSEDTHERYRDAIELGEALREFKNGYGGVAKHMQNWKGRGIKFIYVCLLMVAVIFLAVGTEGYFWEGLSHMKWYILTGILLIFPCAATEHRLRLEERKNFIIRTEETRFYTDAKIFELMILLAVIFASLTAYHYRGTEDLWLETQYEDSAYHVLIRDNTYSGTSKLIISIPEKPSELYQMCVNDGKWQNISGSVLLQPGSHRFRCVDNIKGEIHTYMIKISDSIDTPNCPVIN